ncbi:DHH family phosphoesterase [Patulibacter defluvii]|uniref:DHH family phosphoesterase n=1 Tax=Patulibacter defluvii TaxID=3095358 RepID=UPI002A759B96|nr:bifunctional oligoribonuclease/PAP phosphatase NrnA [Patulibacter sp. DM4]
MNGSDAVDEARRLVVEALRDGQRFVAVTHEHPDGDALGSLVALTRSLRALGKDVVSLVGPDDLPVPREYSGLATDQLVTEVPADLAERTAVFLDCGNIDRAGVAAVREGAARIINLDHHHDNTRFGDIDLVDPDASCTAEILWDLLPDLGLEADRETAEALYVGLVTDTGRFMYENTRGRAHLMAADLLAAGVEPFPVYRKVYEGVPWSKLALLARALDRVRQEDEGRLTFTLVRREDYERTGAQDSDSEGIIDHLRTVAGTRVAAFARELPPDPDGGVRTKVSLRSADGRLDVSVIARAGGGGGHPQAAGFTTGLDEDELVAFLRGQVHALG